MDGHFEDRARLGPFVPEHLAQHVSEIEGIGIRAAAPDITALEFIDLVERLRNLLGTGGAVGETGQS